MACYKNKQWTQSMVGKIQATLFYWRLKNHNIANVLLTCRGEKYCYSYLFLVMFSFYFIWSSFLFLCLLFSCHYVQITLLSSHLSMIFHAKIIYYYGEHFNTYEGNCFLNNLFFLGFPGSIVIHWIIIGQGFLMFLSC